jgi:hypothetical protein
MIEIYILKGFAVIGGLWLAYKCYRVIYPARDD